MGNFLLKSHCKQESYNHFYVNRQRRSDYTCYCEEINETTFRDIINCAFAFLNVTISCNLSHYLFHLGDKNGDGYLNAQEFFQVTYDNFRQPICLPPEVPKRRIVSKLRINIWSSLQTLFERFRCGRRIEATEIRQLIVSITGEISERDGDYICKRMVKLNIKFIEFKKFAKEFLYCCGKLGLKKWSSHFEETKRTISKTEFSQLIADSFNFCSMDRFKGKILDSIYAKISQKGTLTYGNYLYQWVKKYICIVEYEETS